MGSNPPYKPTHKGAPKPKGASHVALEPAETAGSVWGTRIATGLSAIKTSLIVTGLAVAGLATYFSKEISFHFKSKEEQARILAEEKRIADATKAAEAAAKAREAAQKEDKASTIQGEQGDKFAKRLAETTRELEGGTITPKEIRERANNPTGKQYQAIQPSDAVKAAIPDAVSVIPIDSAGPDGCKVSAISTGTKGKGYLLVEKAPGELKAGYGTKMLELPPLKAALPPDTKIVTYTEADATKVEGRKDIHVPGTTCNISLQPADGKMLEKARTTAVPASSTPVTP